MNKFILKKKNDKWNTFLKILVENYMPNLQINTILENENIKYITPHIHIFFVSIMFKMYFFNLKMWFFSFDDDEYYVFL